MLTWLLQAPQGGNDCVSHGFKEPALIELTHFFSAYLNLMNVLCEQQLVTNSDSLHEENEHEWSVNKALLDPLKAGTFPELRADFKPLELCNQRKGWSCVGMLET